MIKGLITLSILIFTTTFSLSQSNYDRYLKQGVEFYNKKDYLTALERFDLAYELARTNAKKNESREWKNKCKEGIKKQAKDLRDAARMREEALKMIKVAEEQSRIAMEQEEIAKKHKALARLKEFELSKTLKAIYFYDQQYVLAYKENLFGYIDREGNIKIDYKYQQAGSFDEYGFARVKKDNKYYLIDTAGTEYLLAVNLESLNQSIKAIDLRNWHLAKFPKQLLKYPQIEILLLGDNQIVHISEKIARLSNLKVIELKNNKLSKEELEKFKTLLPICSLIH